MTSRNTICSLQGPIPPLRHRRRQVAARDAIAQRAFGIVFEQDPVAGALDAVGCSWHAAQSFVDFFLRFQMFEVEVVVAVCFDDDPVSLRTSEEPGDFQDLVVVSVSDYEAVAAAADEFAYVNAAAVDEDYAVHRRHGDRSL